MREIKFRGVRDTEDALIEIVYGDLTHDAPGSTAYGETHPYRISWKEGTAHCNAPIRKGTAMQFTGLKDRNGKEIYEGDIVNIIDPHVETLGEVVYWTEVGRSYATFGVMGSGTFSDVMAYGNGREIEVIGNVYEAPELLNSDTVQANTEPKSELAP